MTFIIRSIVSIVVIFAIVFAVTNFQGPIQKTAGGVLGVHIAKKQSEALPVKLQQDVSTSIEDVSKQSKQVSLDDVTGYLERTQKIIKDYQVAQHEIQKTVDTFFEKRKTDEK